VVSHASNPHLGRWVAGISIGASCLLSVSERSGSVTQPGRRLSWRRVSNSSPMSWRPLSYRRYGLRACIRYGPLLAAIVLRTGMSTLKFRDGRRIGSASLVADAWNVLQVLVIAGTVDLRTTSGEPKLLMSPAMQTRERNPVASSSTERALASTPSTIPAALTDIEWRARLLHRPNPVRFEFRR
jgi:hypothetical protein